eukprot:m.103958 g.103958  ORF g.103958 m.103958 type:complete len:700 (+) comp13829_c0_seq3:133-2232(+)
MLRDITRMYMLLLCVHVVNSFPSSCSNISSTQCIHNLDDGVIVGDYYHAAYINTPTAFLYLAVNESLPMKSLTVDLQVLGSALPPQHATLSTTFQNITFDISLLKDGEYTTIVSSKDESTCGCLVRRLRKSTITHPQNPKEPIPVDAGISTMFLDDYWIYSMKHVVRTPSNALQTRVTNDSFFGGERPWEKPVSPLQLATPRIQSVNISVLSQPHQQTLGVFNCTSFSEGENWFCHDTGDTMETGTSDQDTPHGEFHRLLSTKEPAPLPPPFGNDVTYRMYNKEQDGPVQLDQVKVVYTGYAPTTWGNIKIPAISSWPMWHNVEKKLGLFLTASPLTSASCKGTYPACDQWNYTNDNFAGQWMSADKKTLMYGQGRRVPRFPPFTVPYDNLAGFSRTLVIWRTQDGVSWTPSWFQPPVLRDGPLAQQYGANVFLAEGGRLYLAFIFCFNATFQQMYLDLAYSRDGLYWERLSPNNTEYSGFLPNGDFGEWNGGLIMGTSTPVLFDAVSTHQMTPFVAKRAHFMYPLLTEQEMTEENVKQDITDATRGQYEKWPYWKKYFNNNWKNVTDFGNSLRTSVGMMSYRTNGYASLQTADGYAGGYIITKAIDIPDNTTLGVNCESYPVNGGFVSVSVLRGDNMQPLPQYSGDNAARFQLGGGDVDLVWSEFTTHKISVLPQVQGGIRLNITIEGDATLYSLNWH